MSDQEASGPQMKDSEQFRALRLGDIEHFNQRRAEGEDPDLVRANLRACDLRGAHLEGLSLADAYLKLADLRGLDLRECNLEGASLHNARVGGTYFPLGLDPQEIQMSLQFGTRIRIR